MPARIRVVYPQGGPNSPIITTSALPNGVAGSPYSASIVAVNGVLPLSWTLVNAAPNTGNWVSLNQVTGQVTGTPPEGELEILRVQVTDALGRSGFASISLLVTGVVAITNSSLPNASLNSPYSAQLTATGGVAPYTFTLVSGADSNGFPACSASGALSGTPTAIETLNLVFKVTDSLGVPSAPTNFTVGVTSFAFYIGPNAPVTNVGNTGGTQANPWNIAAINDPTSRGLYSGKSIGLLDGTYNVNAQINSLGGSAGVAPFYNIEGGTPASPTIIQAVNPRKAILNGFANNDGVTYPTTGAFMIGQAISAVSGQPQISHPGNVVIDSIACTGGNGGFISLAMDNGANAPGTQIPGHVVQNCETYSTIGDSSGNLGHIKFRNCLNNVARNNLCHGTYANAGTAANSSVLFGFTNVGGLYEFNTLYDSPTLIHDKNYQLNNPTYRYNYLELNSVGGLFAPTGAFEDCTGGAQGTTVQLYNNVIYCNTGGKFYDGDDAQTGAPPPPFPYPPTSAVCSVQMFNNSVYINGGTVGVFMQCLGNAVAGGVTINPPASLSHWNNIWYLTGSLPTGGAGANGAFGQCQGTGCQGVQDFEIIYCLNPNTGNVAQTRVAAGFASTNPITGWTMAQWRAAGPWHANSQILTTPAATTVFAGPIATLSPTGFQLASGALGKGFGRVGGVVGGAVVDSGAYGGANPPSRIGCNFTSVFGAGTLQFQTPAQLPASTIGTAANYPITPIGGQPPYTVSLVNYSANLKASGVPTAPTPGNTWTFSGGSLVSTPAATEIDYFLMKVVDSASPTPATFYQYFATSVSSGTNPLVISTPVVLGNVKSGSVFTLTAPLADLNAVGGTGSLAWSLTSQTGLNAWAIDPSMGKITGSPAHVETDTLNVSVSDGTHTATQSFYVTVNSVVTGATRPAGNTGLGFFTLGTELMDANGTIFRIRGCNQVHYDSGNATKYAGLNGSVGINCVRYGLYNGQTDAVQKADFVTQHLNNHRTGIIARFGNITTDSIQTTTVGNSSGMNSTALLKCMLQDWANAFSVWGSIQNSLAGINVANEWGNNSITQAVWGGVNTAVIQPMASASGTNINIAATVGGSSNPFAATKFAWFAPASGGSLQMVNITAAGGAPNAWTVTTVEAVTGTGGTLYGGTVGALRGMGYLLPIMIDPPNFGGNVSIPTALAASILASDPQHNVIFSWHEYGNTGTTPSFAAFQSNLAGFAATGCCFVLGEFGFLNDVNGGHITTQQTIQGMEAAGIGGMQWAMDDNPGPPLPGADADDSKWNFTYIPTDASPQLPTNKTVLGKDYLMSPTYGVFVTGKAATSV